MNDESLTIEVGIRDGEVIVVLRQKDSKPFPMHLVTFRKMVLCQLNIEHIAEVLISNNV